MKSRRDGRADVYVRYPNTANTALTTPARLFGTLNILTFITLALSSLEPVFVDKVRSGQHPRPQHRQEHP